MHILLLTMGSNDVYCHYFTILRYNWQRPSGGGLGGETSCRMNGGGDLGGFLMHVWHVFLFFSRHDVTCLHLYCHCTNRHFDETQKCNTITKTCTQKWQLVKYLELWDIKQWKFAFVPRWCRVIVIFKLICTLLTRYATWNML